MSGIFGLLDPAGVDARALEEAAGRASYRGRPVTRALGPMAFGAYVRDGQPAPFIETESSLLVADARVDAALPSTHAARLARTHSGLSMLEALLADAGPDGLAGVAADFALAWYDVRRRTLLLSHDAFGLRPLFWGRRARRVGFASDPAVLIALGLGSEDLEPDVVAAYLAHRSLRDDRTAFHGVRRVGGGRWRSFDIDGRSERGRWFRPEDVAEERAPADEISEAVAEAVVAAVRSRTSGRRVALALSGGRDSGSIALALAGAGVFATCLTQTFEPDLDHPDEGPARDLAEASGHRWLPVPVPSTATSADLGALPSASGTPLGLPAFPLAFSLRDGAVAAGADVLLDGDGGEPLFSAAPVAVLDLVRAGRLATAVAAARCFHRDWTYQYPVIAKAAVRALLPRRLLGFRERFRPLPPWVAGPAPLGPDSLTAPRSARHHLVLALARAGLDPGREVWERMLQMEGVERATPLLDMRVVRLALALPVRLRAPVPTPKPILARALLNGFDGTRVKARFTPYFARLAETLQASVPRAFRPDSLLAQRGFVRAEGLPAVADTSWRLTSLALLPPELWLGRT